MTNGLTYAQAGVDIALVPYKSTGEIMRDLRTVFESWSDQPDDGTLPGYRAARIARTMSATPRPCRAETGYG